jgi:molybdenum cofactor biosynthesis enzyme MoaA
MDSKIELVSIELTRQCSKACSFCYNGSVPDGRTAWTAPELESFLDDLVRGGVRAISFGGGEPLESPLVWSALASLQGRIFRTMTTNGLPLRDPATFERLIQAKPDKVHISIHFPNKRPEVERVVRQVTELADRGIKSGINLLVRASDEPGATSAARAAQEAGITNERIVYLPMRGEDTPSPELVARVAGGRFQSTSCLAACAKSPRFCTVGADRSVAWCSYTGARRPLPSLTHRGLLEALDGLPVVYCGGALPV